jgi:O-antigen ligase
VSRGPAAQRVVVVAAAVIAVGVGVGVAQHPAVGLGLLMVAGFTVLAVHDLRWAVIAFVPLTFFEALAVGNLASKAVGAAIAVLWVASLVGRWRTPRRDHLLPYLIVLGGLLALLALSALWATYPSLSLVALWQWIAVAVLFAALVDVLDDLASIRRVATAFVVGAGASVLYGAAVDYDAIAGGVERLRGGVGDPNYLALGLVPAIVLATALIRRSPGTWTRWFLGLLIPVLVGGLLVTASRGALLAAVVVLVGALVLVPSARPAVVVVGGLVAASIPFWSHLAPGAVGRVLSDDDGGSGRQELWSAALAYIQQRPLTGVGLGNFAPLAGDLARDLGVVAHVRLFNEHTEVHNLYLGLMAEAGLGSLLVALVFFGLCIRAAWIASGRFAAAGDDGAAALAIAVTLSVTGVLTTYLFLSNVVDRRFWILLALGPALLRVSDEGPGRRPASEGVPVVEARR